AAAAAYRLLGWSGAALAAAVVLLTHQESGAPGWLWINLFVAVALARFVPEGRLRAWVRRYQFVSLVAIGLVLIAFGVEQYRFALHPQLTRDESGPVFGLAAGEIGLRKAAFAIQEQSAEDVGSAVDSVELRSMLSTPAPAAVAEPRPRE